MLLKLLLIADIACAILNILYGNKAVAIFNVGVALFVLYVIISNDN